MSDRPRKNLTTPEVKSGKALPWRFSSPANMGSPFSHIAEQFTFRQAAVVIASHGPSQFSAVICPPGQPTQILLNPVRGDYFHHQASARTYAKKVLKGQAYSHALPESVRTLALSWAEVMSP